MNDNIIKAFVDAMGRGMHDNDVMPVNSVPEHVSFRDFRTVVPKMKGPFEILQEFAQENLKNVNNLKKKDLTREMMEKFGAPRRCRRITSKDSTDQGFPNVCYPEDFCERFGQNLKERIPHIPSAMDFEGMKADCNAWTAYIRSKDKRIPGSGNGNKKVVPESYYEAQSKIEVDPGSVKKRERKERNFSRKGLGAQREECVTMPSIMEEDMGSRDVDTIDQEILNQQITRETLTRNIFVHLRENELLKIEKKEISEMTQAVMENLQDLVDECCKQDSRAPCMEGVLQKACMFLGEKIPGGNFPLDDKVSLHTTYIF